MRALAKFSGLLFLLFAACQDPLDPQSRVSKLRILAVRADPAELVLDADAGLPQTTLTALAVNPAGAAPTTSYALCKVLTGVPSADLPCPGSAGIDLPGAGPNAARLDFNDPTLQAIAIQLSVTGGGAVDAGGIQAQLAQGIPLVIGFNSTAPAGGFPDGGPPGFAGGPQELLGFTTITLRSFSARPVNQNPSIDSIQLMAVDGGSAIDLPAGNSFTLRAGQQVKLIPVPAANAKERIDGGLETLGYSFFVTDGELSALRSADTTATGEPSDTSVDWTAPLLPGTVQLWVVVRDGRGGVGWLQRTVQVTP